MYGSLLDPSAGVFGEFERLRQQLDDAFGGTGPGSIRSVAPGSFPAINVGHTPESIEIQAFAPGLDASTIDLVIDRGVLTISGERAAARPGGEGRTSVYGRERPTGAFRRAVNLPDDADAGQVSARYVDGVLLVTIARRGAVRPQRIQVQ